MIFGKDRPERLTNWMAGDKKRAAIARRLAQESLSPTTNLKSNRFRPLGKPVIGNFDRIADVDDLGN